MWRCWLTAAPSASGDREGEEREVVPSTSLPGTSRPNDAAGPAGLRLLGLQGGGLELRLGCGAAANVDAGCLGQAAAGAGLVAGAAAGALRGFAGIHRWRSALLGAGRGVVALTQAQIVAALAAVAGRGFAAAFIADVTLGAGET